MLNNDTAAFNTLDGSFNTLDEAIRRVARVEAQVRNLSRSLSGFYIKGRLRTDRVAPANSADVQGQDAIYDRVLDQNFEYILIDNAGTLEWRQAILSAF
jgi:hypothetical protein